MKYQVNLKGIGRIINISRTKLKGNRSRMTRHIFNYSISTQDNSEVSCKFLHHQLLFLENLNNNFQDQPW